MAANRFVILRPYRPDDAPALLDLFRDTIRRVNSRDYAPKQVEAWASDEIEPESWAESFAGRFAVVVELAGRPIGFADLETCGHIDRLYVSADHQRRGVGRNLLDALADEGQHRRLPRLFVAASITARPFFEDHGFRTLAEQVVSCRGAQFVNYRMERRLGDPPS